MQGTMVMLLALSGLGCGHSAHQAPVYDSCYSACYGGVAYDACYDACYSACYGGGFVQTSYGSCYDSCYGAACYGGSCYAAGYDACYSSCYGGSCYGGSFKRKHGGLFSCFGGGGGGLFGHKHKRAHYDACYSACYGPTAHYDACYSACYFSPVTTTAYDMPVFGTYTPAVSPQAGYGSPQGGIMMSPSKSGMTGSAQQPYNYGTTPATPAPTTPTSPSDPTPTDLAPPADPAPAGDLTPAPATDLDTFDSELPTPPAGDTLDFPEIDPNT